MRNGNKLKIAILCLQINVLILPMRNGNKYKDDIIRMKIKSSYPTYEEWKLLLFFEIV